MPGQGPPPQDPTRLVGHGASKSRDNVLRLVPAQPMDQPELPDFDVRVETDGGITETKFKWPEATRRWWSMWGDSPLAAEFTSTDWDFLMDTALLHAQFWNGDMKVAGELRLRVAKFGATPEDRARLRIQFAIANQKDTTGPAAPKSGDGKPRRKLV